MASTIEVDPDLDNYSDSNFSRGSTPDTESLTSSICQYVYENGRRYHAYFGTEKNIMPTDEEEQDRMDMTHEGFLLLMGEKLHHAPLDTPQRILDVGTGTGIWVVDMAQKYPMAEVIGMDLSPIQPVWVPPNCRFEVDDAEKPWTYQHNLFDFIHMRNIAQALGDWPALLKQAYTRTKPGGYTELVEYGLTAQSDDDTLAPDEGLKVFLEKLAEGMAKLGRSPPVTAEMLVNKLTDAGFVDVVPNSYKQPFGLWPKDPILKRVGTMALVTAETGSVAYGMLVFTKILGMSAEDATALCKAAADTVRNKKVHSYIYVHVATGRKGEKEEDDGEDGEDDGEDGEDDE